MERFLPEREQRPRKPHQPPRWAGLGPSSRFGGRVRNAPAAAPARASRTLAARGQWAAGRLNLHGGRGESGRLTVTRKCDNPERWLSPTRGGPSLSAAARPCVAQGPSARTQCPAQRTHSPRRGCPTSPHVDARGSRPPRGTGGGRTWNASGAPGRGDRPWGLRFLHGLLLHVTNGLL